MNNTILIVALADGLLMALVALAVAFQSRAGERARFAEELGRARDALEQGLARAHARVAHLERLAEEQVRGLVAAEQDRARVPAEPASWWEAQERRQLMVHLIDDTTIRGVVREVTEEGVLLTSAEYLGERTVSLGGEVFVARERVAFTQVPPATNGVKK